MKNHFSFISIALLVLSNSAFSQVLPPVMNPILGSASVCSMPAASNIYFSSASNTPTSYSWLVLPSQGVIISSPNTSTTQISFPNTNFTYTIYCMASNAGGTSLPTTFIVTVFETPSVTFSGGNSFCQGSSTNLSASPTIISASSTLFYNWSPSIGLNTATAGTVVASPPSTTNYTVLLTLGSCTNNAFVTVSVNPLPLITPVLSKTLICVNETAALNISGTANSYSLNSFASPSQTILLGSQTGTSSYTISGKNGFNCVKDTIILLKVNLCSGFNLKEIKELETILIYPNPSIGEFYLKSESTKQEVVIINELGQKILLLELEKSVETKVSGLKNGLYFILGKDQRSKILINNTN